MAKFLCTLSAGGHRVIEGDSFNDAWHRAHLPSLEMLTATYERVVNLSGLYPGCSECQVDGMQEHYAGVHLCFNPRTYDLRAAPQESGREVWEEWIREQQMTEV